MTKVLLACALLMGALTPQLAQADRGDRRSQQRYVTDLVDRFLATGRRGTVVIRPDRAVRGDALALAVDDPDLEILEVRVRYANGHAISIRPNPANVARGAAISIGGDRWPVRSVRIRYVNHGRDRRNAIELYAMR
jgi:hypothetical protein